MVWLPCNDLLGKGDDEANAARYLEALIDSDDGKEMRERFLQAGPEALEYLQRRTSVSLKPVEFYPDYYPDLEGFSTGRRVLEPVPFDGSLLGNHFSMLRPPMAEFTLFGGMMVAREDIPHFRHAFRSIGSFSRVTKLLGEYALQRLRHHRGTRLVLGNALAAQLFKSLLDRGVEIHVGTDVLSLDMDDERVQGALLQCPEGELRVRATKGVVLASGGFSHNAELRARYLPSTVSIHSPYSPGSTGDGIQLGLGAGGIIEEQNTDNAYWAPASIYRKADGRVVTYPHTVSWSIVQDSGLPTRPSRIIDSCNRCFGLTTRVPRYPAT
jgi:hypothetical protein